jgi:hypothetical protein
MHLQSLSKLGEYVSGGYGLHRTFVELSTTTLDFLQPGHLRVGIRRAV